LALALALGTILAAPAWAEETPIPSSHDARVRTVNYDPMNVVKVVAANHRSTSIQFDPTEVVDGVSNPDEKAWVVAPHGSMVFITPFDGNGGLRPTNMQIVTRRSDGSSRIYQFDMVAQDDPNGLMAGVVFRYPADAAAKWRAERDRKREEASATIARQRLDVDFMYGPRNWAYDGRGSRAIEPTEISDNGEVTAMRFPGISQIPTVYTGMCGDHEAVASTNMRDDLVVVHAIAPGFCLRLGAEVFEVNNCYVSGTCPGQEGLPHGTGINPMTGTTTPEVTRTVRGMRH
jgi:type IV secretion system protein VirB9